MRRKSSTVAQHQQQQHHHSQPQHKKYNIWSTGLQEESLLENLKGCGVANTAAAGGSYDRSIESYDYSLKYRLNGENTLKRRQSSLSGIDDDLSIGGVGDQHYSKRFRASSFGHRDRKNVRLRLGHRSSGDDSNDGTKGEAMHAPRLILDLMVTQQTTNDDVARQIANKLYEEKDDLLCTYDWWWRYQSIWDVVFSFSFCLLTVKIVEVLGRDLPMELFGETKKIESEGGMLILVRILHPYIIPREIDWSN